MNLADCAVFLLVTIVVNGPLSPVLPATYEPLLIFFSRILGPLPTALLGTAGTLFVEYLNYHLHRGLLKTRTVQRVTGGPRVQKVVALFSRRPAFTVWLCAWSPLPYWPVRLLSPMAGLPLSRHLMATALGRFPQYLVVILLGAQLHLSTGVLTVIIVGTTLLTLGAWLVKVLVRRPAAIVTLLTGVLLSWGCPNTAPAQRIDLRIPDGQALGFTIDRFMFVGAEEYPYTSFTFHITQLKRGGMGPDLAIGTFPRILAAYHLPVALDFDAAFNISLPRMTILPRGGASAFLLVGPYGAGYAMGYNFGASILINFSDRNAVRLDLTRREYLRSNLFQAATLSIGIGVSAVPLRR
ncbi:MAG TPA: VTT domain-containing protein [Gemmatimonadales bacterium]|nr:VTT domain-containing protein [Gemmatimonadales bacterium]